MSCAVLSAVVSLGWSRVGLDFCHSASWPTKHRDLDWNTSCSWARLVVQKESIGRGSLQVSLGNITADTATNCGVTHNIYIYMYIYIYILYTFFPWIKLRFSGSSCSVNSSYALPGFFFSGAQASKSSRLAPLCNMPAEYPSCLSVVRVTIGGE